MSEKLEIPRRAHSMRIDVHADTIEDLEIALNEIQTDFILGTRSCVSGGRSNGWCITYVHNPKMTHEKYAKAAQEYAEAYKRERKNREAMCTG
jgi:hypothetical protein